MRRTWSLFGSHLRQFVGADPARWRECVVALRLPVGWAHDELKSFNRTWWKEVGQQQVLPTSAVGAPTSVDANPACSSNLGSGDADVVEAVTIPFTAYGVLHRKAYVMLKSEKMASALVRSFKRNSEPSELCDGATEDDAAKAEMQRGYRMVFLPYRPRRRVEGEGKAPSFGGQLLGKQPIRAKMRQGCKYEQQEALKGLTLDRVLLSPDLLWDIELKHARRRVVRGDYVLPTSRPIIPAAERDRAKEAKSDRKTSAGEDAPEGGEVFEDEQEEMGELFYRKLGEMNSTRGAGDSPYTRRQ